MSRIARKPIKVPKGVTIEKKENALFIKGKKADITLPIHNSVEFDIKDDIVKVSLKKSSETSEMLGTAVVLLKNSIIGANEGYERKLQLIGVGYRAKAQGNKLELTLGFSHPVAYQVPKGITVETPSNTEIILKGVDKRQLGQVAADIRAFRPPESYKGKGIRYAEEKVILKETKKK